MPRLNRTDELRALLRQRTLVCDGAMGTQLQALGLAPSGCGLLWNVDAPHFVQRVHEGYLKAGADLLTTNTFSGTALALAAHGLEARGAELNRAGAEVARAAAGTRAFVLGDIGPFGGMLEPYGETTPEAATDAFRTQADALLEGGADAILVETMSDPVEASLAIAAARAAGAGCVMATFTFQHSAQGLRTMMGTDVATAVRAALDAGAEIVGANCGTELSLAVYAGLAAELVAAAAGHPVMLQPNAGSPTFEGNQLVYSVSPAEFAEAGKRFWGAGVCIVGGCCGTTPGHIAALRGAM